MYLGKFLKEKRAAKRWTQDEISEKLGIARTTYANYEQNRSRLDASLISKLSSLFQMSADEIRSFAEVKTGEFQEYFPQNSNTNVSSDVWQAKVQECNDLRERVAELKEMIDTQKQLIRTLQLALDTSKKTATPIPLSG